MPRTTVTVADVAKKAGLANTTVAEILRGKVGYNVDTCRRVTAIAQRMGYRPNYLGKALRGAKSMTIGIITPSLDTPIQVTKLEGAEAAAREAGYLSYLVGWGANERDMHARYIHDLLDRRVDGILYFDQTPLPDECLKLLRHCNVPVVYIDWAPAWAENVVRQLREPALMALAKHLHELGHRNVALMTTPWTRKHPERKIDPIRYSLESFGMTLDSSERWLVDPGDLSDKGRFATESFNVMRREIAAGKLPDAVIANNDEGAAAAITALRDANLRIPQDISVVGFDDVPVAVLTRPKLTTIHQPREGIGKAAFDRLHALMKDRDARPETLEFSFELIVRESTGPVRQR